MSDPRPTTDDAALDAPLEAHEVGRLKWRCRRGLVENDLFITRFFEQHEAGLTRRQAAAMDALMAQSDADLLELLLRRREPDAAWASADVVALLHVMRTTGALPSSLHPISPPPLH